jgi:chemotaxis protein MotB
LWLTVYADLVTLLFTFFVLLISMSAIDARSRTAAMGSVSAAFGSADPGAERHFPARFSGAAEKRGAASMYDLVADDPGGDLDFQENNAVQIVSVNAEALFPPDDTVLSRRGGELLEKLFPRLMRAGRPLLVAGHSSSRRDEEGEAYVADPDNRSVDLTWLLSFRRALAVYRRLADLGMPRERLFMAAYGSSRPRFSENSPEGRRKNRRVDLVLDGRDAEQLKKIDALQEKDGIKKETYYRGFRFALDLPGDAREDAPDGGRGEEKP